MSDLEHYVGQLPHINKTPLKLGCTSCKYAVQGSEAWVGISVCEPVARPVLNALERVYRIDTTSDTRPNGQIAQEWGGLPIVNDVAITACLDVRLTEAPD